MTNLSLHFPELTQGQIQMLERLMLEVIGEDEGNIPLEPVQPDGTQLQQINPKDKLRAVQRQRLKELLK